MTAGWRNTGGDHEEAVLYGSQRMSAGDAGCVPC